MDFPDHTIVIDKFSCYGENVSAEIPYVKQEKEEVKIDRGKPKWYLGTFSLRKLSFKATLMGDILQTRAKLEALVNKPVHFVSPFIGAFDALIEFKVSYPNGTEDLTEVEFEVQEI